MPTVSCCGVTCEVPRFVDLRGFLSFWILWDLRLGPLLGAQLADGIAWRRGDALSPGTLYPALARLTEEGLLSKRRSGRDTRYALTAKGRRELDCARMYLATVFRDVAAGPGALPMAR